VLVLDEPLVYLDEISRSHVRDIVERALGEGVSTILVDHNPFFWEKLEPRLIVLENGRVAYSGKWSRELLEKHTGKFTVTKSTNRASRGVYAELRNVWYRYPGGDYVLVDVNMTIQRGVITAITGPNGSGKTTLLKIASGVLKPSRGSIVRRGASIYIPENPLLYFTMPTPREELLLAARGEEHRVLDIAEYFNIKHTLDQPIARLSSGERRRVALASAYLYEFSGYFIDEPTGGLDHDSARLVLDLLEDIAEDGKAVVIATHDERATKRADLHAEIKK
jgi:energy-coupling factor transport system ATP-binding protein